MKAPRAIAAAAAAAAILVSCDGASLKAVIQGLVAREQLGLIEEITISSAGDGLQMGLAPAETLQTISYDFTISKYEITNAQYKVFVDAGGYADASWWTDNGWNWRAMMGITAPPALADPNYNKSQQPVAGVSWYEAVAFCNWRSAQEGLTIAYDKSGKLVSGADGYRLPTEVEWEYAASKGSPGAAERQWPYGDVYTVGRVVDANAGSPYTQPVGSTSPGGDTREGVADMVGNVAEWCSDNADPPQPGADRYVFVDDLGSNFVMRGGGFIDIAAADCIISSQAVPFDQALTNGFRTVRGARP